MPRGGHGRLVRAAVAVSATLSLLIGIGSAYGFVAYKQVDDTGVIEGFGLDDPRATEGGQAAPTGPCIDVCNYLLLGSDSRTGLGRRARPVRHGPADRW